MKLQVDLTDQTFAAPPPRPHAERLCKRYCNALVLQGHQLARCPHCALCEYFIELFGRRL